MENKEYKRRLIDVRLGKHLTTFGAFVNNVLNKKQFNNLILISN